MRSPPLTCVGPACYRLNDTTTMLEHTLSTYCNSQTAEWEPRKETEQERRKVSLTAHAHSRQVTVWAALGYGVTTAGKSMYQKAAGGISLFSG